MCCERRLFGIESENIDKKSVRDQIRCWINYKNTFKLIKDFEESIELKTGDLKNLS